MCRVGGKSGKVFTIGGWANEYKVWFTFKVSGTKKAILRLWPGLIPVPFLAFREMKWARHYDDPGLSDLRLMKYVTEYHRLATSILTRKNQKEVGLNQP